jgi:hypothetical protein
MDGPTTAGFESLESLPRTKLSARASAEGKGARVVVRNDGKGLAFMVKILARDAKGRNAKPAFYSDNWFCLMPGEEKSVLVEAPAGTAKITVGAWNAEEVSVSRDVAWTVSLPADSVSTLTHK